MPLKTPGPDVDAQQRTRLTWFLVAVVVIVLIAVAAAYGFLWGSGSAPEKPVGRARTGPGGPAYVAAEHVDGDASRLVAVEGGKAKLEVVLRDAVEGEKLKVTMRAGVDAKTPWVFIDRGDPKSSIGSLHATSEGTGKAGETRLSIELPSMPERVTVVDLRFGGKWQGFEVKAPK